MTELVNIYNRLSGKQVKRFATRQRGVELILSVLPKEEVPVPKRKPADTGRPLAKFSVELVPEGKSAVRGESLRGRILAYLKSLPSPRAAITELEEKFGREARGAVQKLMDPRVAWLKRVGE